MNGRPSDYKPEYCELLIDHMSEGLSFESFGGVVGSHRDTLYEWTKVHPEFKEAREIGKSKSRLFWEKLGIEGLWGSKEGPNLNATVWIFNMKNRFQWRDKQPDEDSPANANTFTLNYSLPKKKEGKE